MQKTSVDLEQRQYDLTKSMADNGDADSQSEAIRDAIEYYAQDRGYVNGRKAETQLRWSIRQLGTLFIYIGLGMTVALYWFPVEFRMAALAPIVTGLVCLGGERALGRVEPGISHRLARIFGAEKV